MHTQPFQKELNFQIRHVFDDLRSAARERLKDLKSLAKSKDLTDYYDGARALSVQVGTALTRVWRETREVAQTVVHDFTDDYTREQVHPGVPNYLDYARITRVCFVKR